MEKLKEVEELGGEGLMLRKAGSYVFHVNLHHGQPLKRM